MKLKERKIGRVTTTRKNSGRKIGREGNGLKRILA